MAAGDTYRRSMPLPDPPPSAPSDEPVQAPKAATLSQVMAAVLWSFFGVRKGHAMARDAVSIKPHHVIIAGVLLAAILVISLIVLVQIIISNA